MTDNDRPRRLSLDEILDMVSQVARDDESGADRFRALKMLASMESAAVVLPAPLTDAEMIDRVARVSKGAGLKLAELGFRKAFPQARRGSDMAPVMSLEQLDPGILAQASKVVSIKMLYRAFPEVKRSGTPPGYPRTGSLAARQNWCQRIAAQLILDREQQRADDATGPLG
jgi:hypothetical protein